MEQQKHNYHLDAWLTCNCPDCILKRFNNANINNLSQQEHDRPKYMNARQSVKNNESKKDDELKNLNDRSNISENDNNSNNSNKLSNSLGPLISANEKLNNVQNNVQNGLRGSLATIVGLQPALGEINILWYLLGFIGSFLISFELITQLIPGIDKIDPNLVFGLGSIVRTIFTDIIFFLVLVLGIVTIISGFVLFYNLTSGLTGLTAMVMRNLFVVIMMAFLAYLANGVTDTLTTQVLIFYFYYLIVTSAIIGALGLFNSLPHIYESYINNNNARKTNSYLLMAMLITAVLGPALFGTSVVLIQQQTQNFLIGQMSNNVSPQISDNVCYWWNHGYCSIDGSSDNSIQVKNFIVSSLLQNSSSSVRLDLYYNNNQDKTSKMEIKGVDIVALVNDHQVDKSKISLVPQILTSDGQFISSQNPLLDIGNHWSDKQFLSGTLSFGFNVPFAVNSDKFAIIISVWWFSYAYPEEDAPETITITLPSYNPTSPNNYVLNLQDIASTFGLNILNTVNFTSLILSVVGVMLLLTSLVRMLAFIKRNSSDIFPLSDKLAIFFRPFFPVIISIAILGVFLSPAYLQIIATLLMG